MLREKKGGKFQPHADLMRKSKTLESFVVAEVADGCRHRRLTAPPHPTSYLPDDHQLLACLPFPEARGKTRRRGKQNLGGELTLAYRTYMTQKQTKKRRTGMVLCLQESWFSTAVTLKRDYIGTRIKVT
jgi:hypothetical protein